jgi:hypothetical protein
MRFQYGDPEPAVRSGDEELSSGLSEADELLLGRVLDPVPAPVEEVDIASSSEPKGLKPDVKPVKKSSLSDPYLLDMGMMFASYIPEVHLEALGDEYGQGASPDRPQSAPDEMGRASPWEAGERLENWTLGTEDVFDGANYEAQALTPELRKIITAKR